MRRSRVAGWRTMLPAVALGLLAAAVAAAPALGAFPYNRTGGSATDYKDFFLADQVPADLSGNETWMYSATPEPGNEPVNSSPFELGGVRGGHVVDAEDAPPTAWEATLGRPDVRIAVLDSGIKWNDDGAMNNLRYKTWLNRGELPIPNNDDGATGLDGANCASHTGTGMDGYDVNSDSVFNIRDYACDDRVSQNPPNNVNPDLFEPQDVLIAFTDGEDDDGNGFADDVVGWDFLDDDNDPYDDVQYGHGTGEANDSVAEADNGQGGVGTCPNCMAMHMRVGDSFIADVNRFAAAAIYATDNGALVIQEALGTLNNTRLARQSVDYAYEHGVAVIASAADEAAQHNNWPSSLPHVILVNSVTDYDQVLTPTPTSYLQFNGCTNFNAKITVAIPSVSCSSDATGRGAGMAGLIYSAALNARDRGKLEPHPTCTRAVDGPDPGTELDRCPISANEVRQLMATGTVGGTTQADDVDFVPDPEPSCNPLIPGGPVVPGCTAASSVVAQTTLARPVISVLPETRSYPARGGHDQFYGYGRVNMAKAVQALVRPDGAGGFDPALVPPEVEITSPQWFDQIDPDRESIEVRGQVSARPGPGPCAYRVLVAPGHYPNNEEAPAGDFAEVGGGACGTAADALLATINLDDLEARFPATTDFTGAGPAPIPLVDNGRPNASPHGFTVRVVASTAQEGTALTGEDHRAMWLHRDAAMLPDFPRKLTGNSDLTGDGASSPALADLDGDNRNELIVGSSDGFVHAFRRNGSELPGWPVRGDQPGFLHTGGRAFTGGEVGSNLGGAILASVAVEDVDNDGIPEVFAADLEGKVYGWRATGGVPFFEREANVDFSGKPLAAFQNVRQGKTNRTQHGFLGSPVIADIDGDKAQEIVAANMDRHVYAWDPSGAVVPGYPVLVVDPAKVQSIDPATHRVAFTPGPGLEQQGAIIDTPAVGDLDADADSTGPDELPEIVIGTNEEYSAGEGTEGPVNAALLNAILGTVIGQTGLLDMGNGRLYALDPQGDRDGNPDPSNAIRPGWPTPIGIALTELLPVVGEGITGSPVIAPATCPSGGAGPKVGAMPAAGFAYVLNQEGSSCYGQIGGQDVALQSDLQVSAQKYDLPLLAAVGHPAFGNLGGAFPSFLAPAAGAIRALDLAVNEYQGGQDFVMAWDSTTGQGMPGWPGAVNDLQFLTGPSVADIDGLPGEEVVAGTASMDLAAFTLAGLPVPGWPKLTGDWTVANPTIGSFGTLDAGPGSGDEGKAVIGLTRSGYLLAYDTDAGACTPSSWPRFHHDNANSGDYSRDAVLPGKPTDPDVEPNAEPTTMSFTAPGDDLLCATADRYEIVSSNNPITESNFDDAPRELCGFGPPTSDCPDPAAPGSSQSFTIPDGALRYVALRAVDEQDNVGRIALFDKGSCVADGIDDDCDGVDNTADNCAGEFNPGQADNDGDAQGDICDPDDDNDGVNDAQPDNCQFVSNPDQLDFDGDGEGNACDATPGNPPGGGQQGGGVQGTGAASCANALTGTRSGDRLRGTEASDRIAGLRGADRISGLGGDDCLFGNKGPDRVRGGAGDDEISGGNHRDRLVGGPGEDTIRAGTGRDVIKARDGEPDVIDCGGGVDRVKADRADKLTGCELVGAGKRPRAGRRP